MGRHHGAHSTKKLGLLIFTSICILNTILDFSKNSHILGALYLAKHLISPTVNRLLIYSILDTKGNTPLHNAILGNKTELLTTLTQYEKFIDLQNTEGETALHLSAQKACLDTTKLLIVERANPWITDKSRNTRLNVLIKLRLQNDTLLAALRKSMQPNTDFIWCRPIKCAEALRLGMTQRAYARIFQRAHLEPSHPSAAFPAHPRKRQHKKTASQLIKNFYHLNQAKQKEASSQVCH